jgi:glycerol-3-phosphate dehydrogenase (NAD(P)+)
MTPYFRVYTQTDVTGVETGGALKNIIALCAGILEGAGFGDNTKAALMTRGMAEIIRLGMAMGARRETFSGLTGYGDLVVTCTSAHSRNRRCGILIGQGICLEEAMDRIGMVVEGVQTTRAAMQAAKRLEVSMPITREAYRVLFEGKSPREAIMDLMTREPTSEEPV